MRKKLVKTFISALKENIIPWQRNWKEAETPRNALSGKEYRGLNVLWLQYVSQEKGYVDPRWCTSRQAMEKGWKIKEGEEGTRIEYYALFDKRQNKNISFQEAEQLQQKISPEEYQERIYGITKDSIVFNAEQMEGISAVEKKRINFPAEELLKQRDAILNKLGLKFEEGGDRARYYYHEDKIRMPPLERFNDAYGYMSTFLHEVGHATGHKKRLCRDLPTPEGSLGYAKEELRAEITSAFIGQELNLPMTEEHINNHKAYIQGWIQVLEKDPYELIDAIIDAEEAADYIIEKLELLPKSTDIDRMRDESEAALDLHKKNRGIMEKQADSDSRNAVREVGKIKILGLYEWRGKNGCVHYKDQDGRRCLTDGMTILKDVDFNLMNSIGGLTDTRGIDADLFAEKLRMYHPDVEFSERQLRWIDKKTEKRSVVPPEDNGITILNLYEVDGKEQYVHFSFRGEEKLTDGDALYSEPEGIKSVLKRDGMAKVSSVNGAEIMGKLNEVQDFEIVKRLMDSLSGLTNEGMIRMPDMSESRGRNEMAMSDYIKVSPKLASMISSQNPDVSLYQNADGKMEKTQGFVQKRGACDFVNAKEFYGRNNFYPTITCLQSENPLFKDNMIYSVSEFDDLIKCANMEFKEKKRDVKKKHGSHWSVFKHGSKEEVHCLGYEKIRFTIDSKQGQDVIHRPDEQDIGDGEESMLEYLSAFPSNDVEVQKLKWQASIEKGTEKKRIFSGILKGKHMTRKKIRTRGQRL
jgi:Antirestriction protein